MKHFYMAVQIEKDGKYYACTLKTSEMENLVSQLTIMGVTSANIFETKKRASEVVDAWNKGYSANGKYLFDAHSF